MSDGAVVGGILTLAVVAGLGWTYHAFFLDLALIPTAVIAVRTLGNVDTIASLVVDHVGSADAEARSERSPAGSGDG